LGIERDVVTTAVGPRHRLESPAVDRPWSVVGGLVPPRPPRRPLRRAGGYLLEWGIRVFESSPGGGS